MAVLLGPVLRFRGHDHAQNLWRISALVCVSPNDPLPVLTASAGNWQATPIPLALDTTPDGKVFRFDLDVPLLDQPQDVQYQVDALPEVWHIRIPERNQQPVFAYASCNGFSSLKLMKSVRDVNALWKHMAVKHADIGYHLLLMGGDQVYSDAMWELIPQLEKWNEVSWNDKAAKAKVPAGLPAALLKHFFIDMYCKRWSQPEIRRMLAQVPTIMMWDDHDIMDGWGSYKEEWAQNPVYQLIFQTARRCFELFQLQDTTSDPAFIPGTAGYSQMHHFTGISLLVPDLRSERRLDQVLSPQSWDAIYQKLDGLKTDPALSQVPCRHLIVMSSIPVMHARFSQIESILGWVPGQQELEDDLHDHWSSRPHRGERLRLIHRLLDISKNKGIRVIILSGDVHVAAHATISSNRDGEAASENTLVQLTASGIVHPAPPAIMRFALNTLFSEDEEIDRGITGHMEKMPGDERRYVAARNWLSLERDDPKRSLGRLWANWFAEEGLDHPFTRVIHPLK